MKIHPNIQTDPDPPVWDAAEWLLLLGMGVLIILLILTVVDSLPLPTEALR
ncbi:MAG: hypothetical protein KIT45_06750 [Fimbriimonadia bacterium]|nr:hypothetical protein [Fimbriimonadia bacterium]